MLKQLVILNSELYGKASLRLDDCDSMQLVGPNSIGKSTLIYALNFLFIIDGKKMTFSGNRSGDKETLHHYFPSTINSYIIFEIFKQRYYCIMLKRDNEGDIEYFRIDSEYREELFLKSDGKQQKVLKFEEVRTNLIDAGITLYPYKNKTEVFNFIYQRGKNNPAVVWLDDSVVSDGLSNNFSKVYRYVCNSKLLNNRTLKESLIIADNRDKVGIDFTQKSRKDINDLFRINDEIKGIKNIQKDFGEFRETVNSFKAKTNILSELIFAFNQQYQPTLIDQETNFFKKKKEIADTTIELNETLTPKKQELDREIGGKQTELKLNQEQQSGLQTQINEINSFEGIDFLNQTFLNLDDKRKEIETRITRIQSQQLSSKQIEQKITSLTQTIERVDKQIKNFSNQLIHKLTDKQKDKEILNYILSPDFSASSVETVKKKITKLETLMSLFDGEIKLQTELKRKEIPSIETLKEELTSAKRELEQCEKDLPIAKNIETAQKELESVNASIKEVNEKIRKTELKPNLVIQLSELTIAFTNTSNEKGQLEKTLKILSEEITRKTESITILTEAKDKYEKRVEELRRWKGEVEDISIEPKETENTEGLNPIYSKIKLHSTDRENLKTTKDIAFEKLKSKIKSTIADETLFVNFVADEIACLPDKQKSIDTFLQAISTQFANPALTLIRRYQDFKEFIYNKFNSKLSRTKISDIESVKIELNDNKKLIEELRKISSIEELKSQMSLDFQQSENLKVLNNFLESERKIEFEELFDLELHIKKNGKERKVDLEKQADSDGTDRMIRLVIIMTVINKLAISSKENMIVIFIDEIAQIDGMNRPELFKFCKEHNFLPICVSTEETMLNGFDKYYLMLRPKNGSKVNLNEKQHVIRQTSLIEDERS